MIAILGNDEIQVDEAYLFYFFVVMF